MQDTLPGINTEHKSLLVRGRWQICSEAGATFIPRTGDIHVQRSWHLQRSLPARSEICERTRCCRRLSVAAYHPLPKSPPAAIGRGVRPVCAPRGLCESGWAAFGLLHYLLWAEGIHRLLQATQAVAGGTCTFSWCSNAPGMRESALRMLSPWTRLEASTETEDVDDLEAGTLADHHDAQQDLERRYDEINVRTMFDMREDIGDQKLFFLTNHQARLGRA